jgi:DNA-binding XRE family transcriptional regulator
MAAIPNIMIGAFSTETLGGAFRENRKALNRSQQWVAERVGCRRQTIADLEAGRNVETYTLIAALAALGKGLEIVDPRVDFDRIREIFPDDED